MVTELSSLILAVAFALASLITISILERLANVEGNLLKTTTQTYIKEKFEGAW